MANPPPAPGRFCEGGCNHPSIAFAQPRQCLSCHAPAKVELRGPKGGKQGTAWVAQPKACIGGCGKLVYYCKPDGKPVRLEAVKDQQPAPGLPIHVCPNAVADDDLMFSPLPAGLDFAPC